MPTYFYKAKNLKGEEKFGVLSVQNPSHLARILRKRGYFLISAEKKGGAKKSKFTFLNLGFLKKFIGVPLAEKLFFTRNLRVMVKTGVSLPRAFKILSIQTKNEKLRKALETISGKIAKGKSLSESLRLFPEIFSNLYQETLKVGEETGTLEDSLKILSNQMEREYDLKSKIRVAMVYPMIILTMAFLIGIFMMIFVVPKLKATFEELDVELPFTTKIVLSSADFLIKNWLGIVFIVAILIFVLVIGSRSQKGGKFKSKLTLKIPVISKIVRQTNSALALRTLGSLLKAGVPIVRALEIASGALSNFYFKESLIQAAKSVEKGEKVSQSLKPYQNIYPPMVLEMMEIGEETGETSEILESLADFYEEEVANSLQKLSSVIEPTLIVIIGVVVGFFAVSMIQPMSSIMKGL